LAAPWARGGERPRPAARHKVTTKSGGRECKFSDLRQPQVDFYLTRDNRRTWIFALTCRSKKMHLFGLEPLNSLEKRIEYKSATKNKTNAKKKCEKCDLRLSQV